MKHFKKLFDLFPLSRVKKLLAILYVALGYFLAWAGKPAELTAFTLCGAIGLIFLNIEKFNEFYAGGVGAKVRHLEQKIEFMEKISQEPDDGITKDTLEKLDEYKLKILDSACFG